MPDALSTFHPAVAGWFNRTFDAPTPAQVEAWPGIQAGQHVLIAAPTGSGKTLAAFLAAIDGLVRQGIEGTLADETQIVYVSPLKALSNDIHRNLEAPLAGIREELAARSLADIEIRTLVRTGDTPQSERASMRRQAPHILVTTPESLYVLLGSESGRAMLSKTRAVIVDEIHAVAGNKRGVHLAISLERLEHLAGRPLTRIGLSATQKPIDEVARFLIGTRDGITIVDSGHVRRRDLALELPPSPLEPVISGEQWSQIYDRIAELVHEHRTTLLFVNTRRQAERAARQLAERIGDENVAAHHGSMARDVRLDAEQRLKRGELRVLVATASLELGIDIGDVDLVCQLGSPRSINAFLQRVGRAGHAVGGISKGRLFPLTRDDLVESAALLDAVRRGELDRLEVPRGAIDVVAQQIAAEVGAQEDDLYAVLRRAWPYRELGREDYGAALRMLAEGFSTRRGRHGALIHHDTVNRKLRPRRGTRLTALTNGGTIPDTADYTVLLEPEGHRIGTVHEDFAVESIAGDVFQLGNTSYRILRVERGIVRVEDAKGQPPSIPFWLGEAPGRTDELSAAVSRLRQEVGQRLEAGAGDVMRWLTTELGLDESPAEQLVTYLAAARAALTVLPTQDTIVFERFFDEAGGMQLVIHSPFGSRVNRAWGLALRKRFCRQFNFELQAAATEDSIVLSLTTAHSFELASVAKYLHSNSARDVLVQALCAAPMFPLRWRWTATVALALPRFRGGKKVPPQIARMNAEDLLAGVFPDQVACAENVGGELEIPDHPLVAQAIRDCLEDAMDIQGFERLLRNLESGAIRVVARDLTEPSPLAAEVLSARPYAYLDDAPLEERRTQAVMSRRWLDPQSAADIGRLDPEAIQRVRDEAWPDAASADELHDALLWTCYVTDEEIAANDAWPALIRELEASRRVVRAKPGTREVWMATERQHLEIGDIVRGRLQALGPTTAASIAASLGVEQSAIDGALLALEGEGVAMRGQFTSESADTEWCERGLLARIHRYTVKRLRAEIEPVQARDFLRFLFEWQRVSSDARMQGPDAVAAVLSQLEGFDAPASAWETELLPLRVTEYEPAWLDEHCLAGRFVWTRLSSRSSDPEKGAAPVRSTPIALIARRNVRVWSTFARDPDPEHLSTKAVAVSDWLRAEGASFFDEIVDGTRLMPSQVEEALAEVVALGLVNSDSFGGLRALLVPADRRRPSSGNSRRRRRVALFGMADAGRWSLLRRSNPAEHQEAVEQVVRTLLKRWGVIFWKLLQRESASMPPWRDILMCCRRLEARGEIRGGRFVAGFSGEQYAATDAIAPLREARRRPATGEYLSLSAADPLNVVGILTPGGRLPALTGNRVLYRDGMPIALFAAGEVRMLERLEPAEEWAVRNALLRRHVPSVLASLA